MSIREERRESGACYTPWLRVDGHEGIGERFVQAIPEGAIAGAFWQTSA